MKALTIWQPWASLIMGNVPLSQAAKGQGFILPKNVENRGWNCRYRGPLLIHAGKRIDKDWIWLVVPGLQLPTGMLLGTVEVVGCVRDSDSRWGAEGQYHIRLSNPKALARPIPYKGAQGLFEVPLEALLEKARAGGGSI